MLAVHRESFDDVIRDYALGYPELRHRFALYVPIADVNGQSIDGADRVLEFVGSKLALAFGGSSVADVSGQWVSPSGELVAERVSVVYSWADSDTAHAFAHLPFRLARLIAHSLDQDCVLLEIDGHAYLVDRS